MPLERLLPHEELALRVALSIRLVLEDDSYSVQAAELCRVAVEVLGSTIKLTPPPARSGQQLGSLAIPAVSHQVRGFW